MVKGEMTPPIDHIPLIRLKKRSEFLNVASTHLKQVTPGLILQYRRHTLKEIQSSKSAILRLGFTVSKKVGNAIVRNRVKRRLKSAAQAILSPKVCPNFDLVIIGRQNTLRRPFLDLCNDLEKAKRKLEPQKADK